MNVNEQSHKIYMIYTIFYDPFGRILWQGFYNQQYDYKRNAVYRARKLYGDNNPRVEWIIFEIDKDISMFVPCIFDL